MNMDVAFGLASFKGTDSDFLLIVNLKFVDHSLLIKRLYPAKEKIKCLQNKKHGVKMFESF